MASRPQSIVKFEQFYLAAFVVGLVNTALNWNASRALYEATPQAAMMGAWFFPVMTLIGFAITLSLWYFIARRGSAVAKWIAVVLLALGLVGLLITIPTGTYPTGISGILGLVATVLQIVAIVYLFKPDTRPWFGETGTAA